MIPLENDLMHFSLVFSVLCCSSPVFDKKTDDHYNESASNGSFSQTNASCDKLETHKCNIKHYLSRCGVKWLNKSTDHEGGALTKSGN